MNDFAKWENDEWEDSDGNMRVWYLSRWDIFLLVARPLKEGGFDYRIQSHAQDPGYIAIGMDTHFPTMEEAKQACVQEAIKLVRTRLSELETML